jgi:MFS superfamily sulfate permease-like transporter
MVTAILYLALIIGEGDRGQIPEALVWLFFMAGAGLAAWFADRTSLRTGRRMMWAAFVGFFVIGVLSIFTIGIVYLLASVLSVIALSRRPTSTATVGQGPEDDQS